MNSYCDQRDGDHCTHELRAGESHYPGEVCCWCGDIFIAHYEEDAEHGEYRPLTDVKAKPKRAPRAHGKRLVRPPKSRK